MWRSSIGWPKRMACSADQTPFGSKRKRSPGRAAAERAVALELVVGREDAALELVGREAVLRLQRAGLRHQLLGGPDLAAAGLGSRVAEEEVRGERHALAQPAAEDLADRHAPLLAEDVEAGELERGHELRAVVVERGGRVRDQEAHLLERAGSWPTRYGFSPWKAASAALAAAAHLAEADEAVVGLDLDDRADEAPPVAAVRVAQRRLERDGDGCGPDVGDLHEACGRIVLCGPFRSRGGGGCRRLVAAPAAG